MSDTILTHDQGIDAFADASGAVSTDDDGVNFSWDEEHIVRVDAPSDLNGAFDTERFYKIEGATIARPIKQHYMVGDSVEQYKKPADELRKAAWTFDNAPYVIPHPDSGMVKDVNDVHGFWRSIRYSDDEDRLQGDLYVPTNDDYALDWIEEHTDVSPGFYNRVVTDYDGDTGDLTNEEGIDGYQVDIYGDHIAGVERGRCSGEDGCGLDSEDHGQVVSPDTTRHMSMQDHDRDYVIAPPTADYEEDGTYYAVAPDENPDGEPKYPINSCSDVQDAWHLRGHGDLDISQDTLESRIKSKASDLGCDAPGSESTDDAADCPCGNMTDDNDNDNDTQNSTDNDTFDIPDLSVDAIAEKNDSVAELKEQRDSFEETIDEMKSVVEEAFDTAENFSVDLDEDECPCKAVGDLVSDLDEKAAEVERLEDELEEYREEDREEALDRLTELGADEDDWAEESLDAIEEEIDRRQEVLDSAPNVSVKDIESSTDSDDGETDEKTMNGTRTFGRGHGA